MKDFIFGNAAANSFIGTSKGFCLTDSVGKIIEELFRRKTFNQNTFSSCFCLCQQFLKKNERSKHIKSRN